MRFDVDSKNPSDARFGCWREMHLGLRNPSKASWKRAPLLTTVFGQGTQVRRLYPLRVNSLASGSSCQQPVRTHAPSRFLPPPSTCRGASYCTERRRG